jgi:uncharacterized protein YqjF (DUF2071 family)
MEISEGHLSQRDAHFLTEVAHRPWPLPAGRWIWSQRWADVFFAHWPVSAEVLRPMIPTGLELDLLDGMAWVSAVSFEMQQVRPRGLPAAPIVSNFPELNVRTYVASGERAGVYFLSIDAGKRVASWLARHCSGLPYRYASIEIGSRQGRFYAACQRPNQTVPCFEADYAATSAPFVAERGSREHWLTERYCLYCLTGGRLYEAQIHHGPWPLQHADAIITADTIASGEDVGLPTLGPPAMTLCSKGVDVVAWRFERLHPVASM